MIFLSPAEKEIKMVWELSFTDSLSKVSLSWASVVPIKAQFPPFFFFFENIFLFFQTFNLLKIYYIKKNAEKMLMLLKMMIIHHGNRCLTLIKCV